MTTGAFQADDRLDQPLFYYITSVKEIGVCAGPHQNKGVILLLPDQQPVGFYMAFPVRRPAA